MSKKSRRRNRRLLKALGAGLAIAGLGGAFRKNAKGSRDADTVKAMTSDAAYKIPKANENEFKEKIYQDAIMRGGVGVKAAKKPLRFGQVIDKEGEIKTIRPFESAGLKLGVSNRKKNMDTYKGYATRTGNSRGDLGLTGRPEKKDYFGATIFPKSQAADNFKADLREYGRGNQYKSGGKVTKRKGAAKRGFGRAFKGGK